MSHISIKKFTDLERGRRIDPEYYQDFHYDTLKLMKQKEFITLDNIASLRKDTFDPTKNPNSVFYYIDINSVHNRTGYIFAQGLLCADAPLRARKIVKRGDVIISTVRPSKNAVAIIDATEDGYVCSTGFAVLVPKSVASEVLFSFLKLPSTISQLERASTATMYPACSQTDILNLFVPNPKSLNIEKIIQAVQRIRQNLRDAELEMKKIVSDIGATTGILGE